MTRHSHLVSAVLLVIFVRLGHAEDLANRLERGLAAAHKGNCEAALVDLKAVAALSPSDRSALNAIGVCETQLGHPERATDSFQRLVSLAPRDAQAWSNLGANRLALGQADLAVTALQEAIKLEAGSASVWFNLGQALELKGKEAEAFRALDRAQGLNPRDSRIKAVWQALAEKLAARAADQIEAKKFQVAKALLIEIRRPLENSASWNNLLGYAEFKLGEAGPALEHLQRAVHMEPDSEDFLLDLGEYLIVHRATDAAKRFFEEGLRRKPNSLRIQFGLAMVYQIEKRHDKAIASFKTIVASHPEFEPAYSALGRSFERTLQWDEMIDLGKNLRTLKESSSLGWHLVGAGLLGRAAQDSGDLTEAILALEKSLDLNSASSDTHFLLAKACELKGKPDRAILELKETLRLDPQHESAHYVLAQLYRKVGKSELAHQELQAHERIRQRKRDDTLRPLVTESKTR
jgi:tetratricopeptide (TPR) repeat protein